MSSAAHSTLALPVLDVRGMLMLTCTEQHSGELRSTQHAGLGGWIPGPHCSRAGRLYFVSRGDDTDTVRDTCIKRIDLFAPLDVQYTCTPPAALGYG